MNSDDIRILVFEMWIEMNEYDHRILALLEQQRERPGKFRPERGFEPGPLRCRRRTQQVHLSGQMGAGRHVSRL